MRMVTPQTIDQWIKSHKMTQKAFAIAIKSTEGHISNIINGKIALSDGMASRIESYMRQIDSETPDLDKVKAFAVRLTEEEVNRLLQLSGKTSYSQEDAETYVRDLLQRTWDARFGSAYANRECAPPDEPSEQDPGDYSQREQKPFA